MTREEHIEQLELMLRCPEYNLDDNDRETIKVCINTLEQEPCEDAISRQAVIDAISSDRYDYAALDRYVKDLPPVTPQQRTGQWITSHIPESVLCECSECGFTCGAYSFNYCPDCGAKMEVAE